MTDLTINKWQSGDVAAFEALFRQYERLVFKNAYLITGTREEAEDVLQDVFVSVWRSRHTFDPNKGKLTTWLHRITVNECHRRRRKKRPALVSLDRLEFSGTQEGCEEALVNKQQRERILEAMNSLDSRHRTVLVLRYLNGLSYEEIARVADIPLGTVKSRMNQALKLLRGQLGARPKGASA